MDRLKQKAESQDARRLRDLHSNMDRLKPARTTMPQRQKVNLHSNMDRLKRGLCCHTKSD